MFVVDRKRRDRIIKYKYVLTISAGQGATKLLLKGRLFTAAVGGKCFSFPLKTLLILEDRQRNGIVVLTSLLFSYYQRTDRGMAKQLKGS